MKQDLLLDTHVLLWLQNEPEKLSAKATSAIGHVHNRRLVSVVSLWEIVIKWQRGNLQLATTPDEFIAQAQELSDLELLPVEASHVLGLTNLPETHNDPFDRLLISQAIAGNLIFVTADPSNRSYPVQSLW